MLLINLETRVKNKAFWLGLVSWVILLCQVFGFDATTIIPKNYVDIFNVIFGFLGYLGIQTDVSTPGLSDSVISKTTVQAINQANEVKTEGSTTSINNTVTENSQESNTIEPVISATDFATLQQTNTNLQSQNAELQSKIDSINSVISPTV